MNAGDTKDLEPLFHEVEDAATSKARRRLLEKELRRMEDYAEAISVARNESDGLCPVNI